MPFKDGREKWYRLKMAHSKGLLSVTAWDITESKQHMFELERRQKSPVLGVTIAVVLMVACVGIAVASAPYLLPTRLR